METDRLIAIDLDDRPVFDASVTKKAGHVFSPNTPRGVAHRAFSVFLFNAKNELLLTRRSTDKITFPGVWTNTCCSHPLRGMVPEEVDGVFVKKTSSSDDDTEEYEYKSGYPTFPGIKVAAVRKMQHELGIPPGTIPIESMKFLSRFHYWAADTVTYGPEAPWGEHEIDYVLFARMDERVAEELTLDNVDPEEVMDYRYVSVDELRSMMEREMEDDESHGDDDDVDDDGDHNRRRRQQRRLWSPWFLGIMERGGFEWWENMDEALKDGGKYCNEDIVFF